MLENAEKFSVDKRTDRISSSLAYKAYTDIIHKSAQAYIVMQRKLQSKNILNNILRCHTHSVSLRANTYTSAAGRGH